MRLEGKIAVVTGGTIGIGAAIGRLFAREGARVALIGRDAARGEKTCQGISSQGGDCKFYVADVSKSDQVAKAAAQILRDYPKVDILVNNAGIWRPGRVVDLDEETWDSVLDTNLKGMFLVSRHFLPGMMERKWGVVINVSSVAGLVGAADASSYAASKGGIVNLSRSMALDFAPFNVRVNCLCPGMTDTAQGVSVVAHYKPGGNQTEEKRNWQPLRRVCTPDDVAKAALYLASDDAEFMTGSMLVIDGGLTAQ
jgi:NAD(P)-dependent dehydrogenase (short-subunit alcohol dehydrogenase family)